MVNEKEKLKILNEGSFKLTSEELKVISNLITTLAEIEYQSIQERGVKK
jgi:hypothetical protein